MRDGRPLKNQTCEQGLASSMWPRRSRRTLRERHLDAALVADDAAVLHALVLAAQALPVGDGSEDARAEQAIALRLEGAVVDGLGLVTSPWDQERIFSGEASWILMASKSMIGPVSSKGLERNIVCVSVCCSVAAAVAKSVPR
jgi:hypothetical protein